MLSAFGVDHGEISKGLRLPGLGRGAKAGGAKRSFEDPFGGPTKAKAIPTNPPGTLMGRQGKLRDKPKMNRNAGLGSSYGGNQGGFSTLTRRQKDLG